MLWAPGRRCRADSGLPRTVASSSTRVAASALAPRRRSCGASGRRPCDSCRPRRSLETAARLPSTRAAYTPTSPPAPGPPARSHRSRSPPSRDGSPCASPDAAAGWSTPHLVVSCAVRASTASAPIPTARRCSWSRLRTPARSSPAGRVGAPVPTTTASSP